MKIVKITWGDAYYSSHDWVQGEELAPAAPVVVQTVGYLVELNTNGYKLAGQADRDIVDSFKYEYFIPHGMIINVEEISSG